MTRRFRKQIVLTLLALSLLMSLPAAADAPEMEICANHPCANWRYEVIYDPDGSIRQFYGYRTGPGFVGRGEVQLTEDEAAIDVTNVSQDDIKALHGNFNNFYVDTATKTVKRRSTGQALLSVVPRGGSPLAMALIGAAFALAFVAAIVARRRIGAPRPSALA